MRADRLLSLLMLLQSRGRMTARELAEQLEVSERTIYRDMEALGIAGIPVCAERGPGGGCFLIDGYQTKLTGLNAAEVRALFLFKMTRPLADLGLSKALDDAMLKLSAALPVEQRGDAEQVRQRIHLDIEDWQQDESSVPHLPAIQEAIWHDRKLLIQYDEGCKLCQQHLIEPYGLVSKASSWYVVAAVAGEQHVFSVSRISTATLSDEHFTRPAASTCPASGQHTVSRWRNAQKSQLLRVLDIPRSEQLPEKKKLLWRAMLSDAERFPREEKKKTVSNKDNVESLLKPLKKTKKTVSPRSQADALPPLKKKPF